MPGEHPLAEVARRLRPFLRDKRALLVGESANNAQLKTIVRLAGARVMAAVDVHAALLLFARYPIDVVLVDPWLRTPTGETFEQLARSKNVEAVVVDYPHRPLAQILVGWPRAERAEEARPRNAPAKRPPLLPDSHPARRRSRRTGS